MPNPRALLSSVLQHIPLRGFGPPSDNTHDNVGHHLGDYSHGFHYEDLFCPDKAELVSFAEYLSQKGGNVLDLGGGAGRFSSLVSQQGISVTLLDKSKDMLEIAERQRLTGKRGARLWKNLQGDFLEEIPGGPYSTVVSVRNGLEHLTNFEQVSRVLENISLVLPNNGDFWFEVHPLEFWQGKKTWCKKRWEFLGHRTIAKNKLSLWERTYAEPKSSLLTWEHAVKLAEGKFKILSTSLLLLPLEIWEKASIKAGFLVAAKYGSWRREPFNTQSPQLIFHLKAK